MIGESRRSWWCMRVFDTDTGRMQQSVEAESISTTVSLLLLLLLLIVLFMSCKS